MIPHRADRKARLIDPRRVGHDAVEVLGETLRLDQALPSAIGTGIPISVRDRFTVVVLGDLLRGCRRQMHGTIRVVDGLLRIGHDKRSAGLFPRIVSRVRLSEGEAKLQRGVALCGSAGVVQRFTRVAAVSNHVEAAVPLRRQAHLEFNFG